MIILALDLATVAGFAFGEPRGEPTYGSHRFGKRGASIQAKAYHSANWFTEQIKAIKPDVIVHEAPMPTGRTIGKTRTEVTTTLHGLIYQLGGIAHALGFYNIEAASILAVRNHFLGTCKLERKTGKLTTIEICRRLGWVPVDDDAADALAIWSYRCSLEVPQLALRTAPLFMRGA